MYRIGWNDYAQMLTKMADAVHDAGVKPMQIVAVANGGLVPGTFMHYQLDVPLAVVRATRKEGVHWTTHMARRPTLVVDDIWDTGRTMSKVLGVMKDFHVPVVGIAVAVYKPLRQLEPPGYIPFSVPLLSGTILDTPDWIEFPYEKGDKLPVAF